jgi:S-DNA-T family DNA segregation ATPase FtsK/SpoIIIE
MIKTTTEQSTSARRKGREVKAALWTARHPGAVLAPGGIAVSSAQLGYTATGSILGGATLGMTAWYRGHPDSFDTIAAPLLRGWRRRWFTYLGWRWRNALVDCDLVRTHRKTGELLVPRILKVRSHSRTVDTLYVRIVPGQHARQFEGKLPELAEALKVERVAIERVKPRVVALVIERREPFTEVIDAPEMVHDADSVDLGSVYVGETEHGRDWRETVDGHLFVSGATGAGKNSISWSLLRAIAPLIRDGVVRVWVADPKQTEFAKLDGVAYRYAADPDDCVQLVDEFVTDMRRVQQGLSAEGKRKVTPSRETPLNILIVDELGALLAYGDSGVARDLRKSLALVGSQGRATGHRLWGFVQEPSKDVVPMRDLFTTRVCLRVTNAVHVDMVLGENARQRGALADEIPNSPDTAGIGYVIRQRSRAPMRVRAAYVDDREVDELVTFLRTGEHGPAGSLRVVA